MWCSRATYMWQVRQWASSPEFDKAKAQLRVCMARDTFIAAVRVMSQFADHNSGRCVAVSRETIADAIDKTARTITTVWQLLRASGLGVEIQRGHGSDLTPSIGCRPSVYNLVSKKPDQRVLSDFHLPRRGSLRPSSSVGKSSKKKRAWIEYPEPVQRLAREMEPFMVGGFRGRSGTLCAAIVQSGLDASSWTGKAVYASLEAEGMNWVSHPSNLFGYLKFRLGRLPATPPEKVETPTPPRYVREEPVAPPASKGTREAAKALLMETLRKRR